jgi:hypothetical protein
MAMVIINKFCSAVDPRNDLTHDLLDKNSTRGKLEENSCTRNFVWACGLYSVENQIEDYLGYSHVTNLYVLLPGTLRLDNILM